MVTVCAVVTLKVVMVNVADDCPEGMFTTPGVDATPVALDATATFRPLAGATVASVMVPVTLVPPVTDVGLTVSWIGGATFTCWVKLVVPRVAVRATVWTDVTAVVGMVTLAVALLALTVTEAGG